MQCSHFQSIMYYCITNPIYNRIAFTNSIFLNIDKQDDYKETSIATSTKFTFHCPRQVHYVTIVALDNAVQLQMNKSEWKKKQFCVHDKLQEKSWYKKSSYKVLPTCDYQTVQLKLEGYSWKETSNQIKLHLHLKFLLQQIAGDT